ncbi:MAG: ABC transporter substrate-binding protein [Anaerolineales bacterium]|nr:ABC transporter substrate-binding protein [Anaerolineales bacterium]
MKSITRTKQGWLFVGIFLLLAACAPKGETPATAVAEAASPQPQPTSAAAPTEDTTSAPTINGANLLLDPAKTEDADSLKISSYLYEGLVRADASGANQPGLAASWTVSEDGLDYVFEIRPNAKFSDGTPISVDAIVENFNRWFEPESPLHKDGVYPSWLKRFLAFNGERDANNRAVSQIDGIQKVDANTVIVHLSRREPNLLSYLAEPAFAILSPAALEAPAYGASQSAVVSSGAYVVSSWTDKGITLSPNPQYWNASATEPVTFNFK